MMPNFARPWVLWLIPAVLAVIGIAEWIGWRLTLRALHRMGQTDRSPYAARRRLQTFMLLAVGVSFALAAVAGPYVKGTTSKNALHAIFVLDVSWSMAAKDYPEPLPTRFERAKDAIFASLTRYREGQIGLVVFAGKAFPRISRMRDFRAFAWMLEHWVQLGQAPSQGSELKAGLETALAVLTATVDDPDADPQRYWRDPVTGRVNYWRNPKTGKINAVVVVLSDGTDATRPPLEIFDEYQKEGVKVLAFGLGSPEGTVVTMDFLGEKKSYPTRLNELPLKAVAEATGGTYVRVVTGRELADTLSAYPEAFIATPVPVAAKELFQWPLGIAVCFAVLWMLRMFRR